MMEENIHECPHPGCNCRFSKPSRLLHHIRTHTGERPYKCPQEGCSKSYTRPAHLNRHLESHKDAAKPYLDKKFMCNVDGCYETFLQRDYLVKHHQRFHEKLYACTVPGCGQVFKKHNLLKCHKAEHSNELPFKCQHEGCQKAFVFRSRLERHQKHHQGFTCKESGCDQFFKKWSLFRKHMAVDHKPVYSCSQCNKSFATKGWLKQHGKTHSDTREIFHCTYEGCPRVYYCSRNLTAHIKSYHLGHRLSCDLCERTFVSKKSLCHHKKMHDPNTPMPKKKRKKISMANKLSSEQVRDDRAHVTDVRPVDLLNTSEGIKLNTDDRAHVTDVLPVDLLNTSEGIKLNTDDRAHVTDVLPVDLLNTSEGIKLNTDDRAHVTDVLPVDLLNTSEGIKLNTDDRAHVTDVLPVDLLNTSEGIKLNTEVYPSQLLSVSNDNVNDTENGDNGSGDVSLRTKDGSHEKHCPIPDIPPNKCAEGGSAFIIQVLNQEAQDGIIGLSNKMCVSNTVELNESIINVDCPQVERINA